MSAKLASLWQLNDVCLQETAIDETSLLTVAEDALEYDDDEFKQITESDCAS